MLENVYEGLNARKCNGRSNQKVQKTKCIYFLTLLLGGPSCLGEEKDLREDVKKKTKWDPSPSFLEKIKGGQKISFLMILAPLMPV